MCGEREPFLVELADGSWIDFYNISRYFPRETPEGGWQLWVQSSSLWAKDNDEGEALLKRNVYKNEDGARLALKRWLVSTTDRISA